MTQSDRKYHAGGERVIWPIMPVSHEADPVFNVSEECYDRFCRGAFWIPLCSSARLAALQLRVVNSLAQEKFNSESQKKVPGASFKHGMATAFSLYDLEKEGVA